MPSHDALSLSGRYKQVAELVALGCSNRDIATELNLPEQIVKNVIHSLFDRLGVWNRVELANRLMVASSAEVKRQKQERIEQQRLTELRRLIILDRKAECIFDELTALAAKIFDVPIALIMLVHSGRLLFKSNFGLDVSGCSRGSSICHHTIQQSKVLVASNAVEDERFNYSSLITENPRVWFYAAAPRQFTEAQLLVLESLARLALQQMDRRQDFLEAQMVNHSGESRVERPSDSTASSAFL